MTHATFVPEDNQTPLPALQHNGRNITLDTFKKELLSTGVCAVYVGQGNHIHAFRDLLDEPELYTLYMHHRKRMFHVDALAQARMEHTAAAEHPFAL